MLPDDENGVLNVYIYIFLVMLETAKTTRVTQDKNNYNLIINHIFHLLKLNSMQKSSALQ